MNCLLQAEFKVGVGNKDYPGYRPLKQVEWCDPVYGTRLLAVHARHGGFPLLEPKLECAAQLHVVEGAVHVAKAPVVEVGCPWAAHAQAPPQTISGVYAAMGQTNRVAWSVTPPAVGNWTVRPHPMGQSPCLFIRK